MILELVVLLFAISLCFLAFGHLKDAGMAFIAGGIFLAVAASAVALDGVEVATQRTATSNYTAPFVWGYNTTFNFSFFTPSNSSDSTTWVYTEVARSPTLPSYLHYTIWLLLAFVGVFYIFTGGSMLYRRPETAS